MAAYFSKNGMISTKFAVINFVLMIFTIFIFFAADKFFNLEKTQILNLMFFTFGLLGFAQIIGVFKGIHPDKHGVANHIYNKIGIFFNFGEILILIGIYLLFKNI